MRRTALLRSSTFRLTLAYLAVFGLSALVLLSFVYGASVTFMERQVMATIDAEVQGLREQYQTGGLAALARTIAFRAESDHNSGSVYVLFDTAGNVLAGNLDEPPAGRITDEGWLSFTRASDGKPVLAQAFLVDGRAHLLVGRTIEDKRDTQRLIRNAVFLGGAVMLVLGAAGGLVLSRWTLARLEAVNRTTTRIMGGDLGQRIAVKGGGDEFDELALNLNAMLERIEQLVAGMREVTDNVAHDLRTPLTRLRARIEVGLMGPLDPATARTVLEDTVNDAETLIATFDALLNIARAEAGEQRASWERVALREICRDVVDLYAPLAEDRHMTLVLRPGPDAAVAGNRHMLAQALANLVDNAIKYAPEGGRIEVGVGAGPPPVVEVADNGPGIPTHLRERALERFVRLAPDRTGPGNGLGLSLVKAVARLHGAALDLDDNRPGLVVRLRFQAPAGRILPSDGRPAEAIAAS